MLGKAIRELIAADGVIYMKVMSFRTSLPDCLINSVSTTQENNMLYKRNAKIASATKVEREKE